MPNDKARRLSDVLPKEAPQGLNDRRWFLLEHQLSQAQFSLQTARVQCEVIGDNPENEEEWELARASLEIISPAYVRVLGAISSVHSLLAGSEIAERVGGIEDE